MSVEEQDQVRDSNYDGIQEYDNNLPRWWLWTLFLTVIVGFVYWTRFYVLESAPNQKAELEAEHEAFEKKYATSSVVGASNESLLAMAKNPGEVSQGETLYQTYCTPCHGKNAEGGIGPNLTDTYWIHGGAPQNIIATINQGVIAKGMTPWKGILSPSQINHVAAFVISKEGSNPPNAKAPQGDPVPKKI